MIHIIFLRRVNALKYKLLLGGENSVLIEDFFCHTEMYFRCLTTTGMYRDVIGHFECFQPDAYVLFLDNENCSDVLRHINSLKEDKCYNQAVIVIVAKDTVCDELRREYPQIADILIRQPVSLDNLVLNIVDYFETDSKKETVETRDVLQPQEKKHILVVDDDRSVLKVVKSILEKDYEVTAIINGTLVEKVLATLKVDAIVLDYEMPVITGAEIYRSIKENPDTRDIPVCFLTGVSEQSKVEEIMMLKPSAYLLKPINAEILLATISNLTSA